MAALGKIRSYGVLLICIIGLGLFGFIAGDLFRSCDSTRAEKSQRVGEILGDKINYQDFSAIVEEIKSYYEAQGQSLQTEQLSDQAWNRLLQEKLIENECEKLGLTVTEKEIQNIFAKGEHPMLQQYAQIPGLFNQQTGKFDVEAYKNFFAQYKQYESSNPQVAAQLKPMVDMLKYMEKQMRFQLLASKYNSLLAGCMISNPVAAKMAFDGENTESDIQLASFAYSSIADKDIKVSNAELKAKYEEMKELYRTFDEVRDIKYVDVEIVPSAADRTALNKEFEGYRTQLADAEDPTEVVRKSGSQEAYTGIAKTKKAYPQDVAAMLDSLAVGTTTQITENKQDNTLNLVRLMNKTQQADSVLFRAIQVADEDAAKAKAKADSISEALNGGADFATVAKNYGQTGDSIWLTSAQYERGSLDKNTKEYIKAVTTGEVKAIQTVDLGQGYIVLQVMEKKAMVDKYDVAVIKKPIEYSNKTSTDVYNQFSAFVTKCTSLDEMQKQAKKSNYEVKELKGVSSAGHYVANINTTKDALKWIFNGDTKEGDVSELWTCGDNGNHLMVIVLDKIHPVGYRDLSDANVAAEIKAMVIRDKKAEQLLAKAKDCKSVADAQKKGAKVSDVEKITFNSATFVQELNAQENALSGAVAGTAKGKFCKAPVKGDAGVYVFSVKERRQLDGKFNAKEYAQRLQAQNAQLATQLGMQILYLNAGVKDNRYLFY